jgi:hypothetical protein
MVYPMVLLPIIMVEHFISIIFLKHLFLTAAFQTATQILLEGEFIVQAATQGLQAISFQTTQFQTSALPGALEFTALEAVQTLAKILFLAILALEFIAIQIATPVSLTIQFQTMEVGVEYLAIPTVILISLTIQFPTTLPIMELE